MSSAQVEGQEVLTIAQASEFLQVDRRTLYKLIKEGGIPALSVGRGYRVLKGDLVKAFKTHKPERRRRRKKKR